MTAAATPAFAQAVLADIHGLSPRQVKYDAFTLTAPQDVHIEAVGEVGGDDSRTMAWVRSLWDSKSERVPQPWVGNAWILDLQSHRTVWELSAANTTEGRRRTREFSSSVRLPAGSYAAYVSAFPPGAYSSDDDGIGSRIQKFFGADGIDEYKLVLRGNGQRLTSAEVDRLRQQATSGAVVALRGTSREQYQQIGFVLDKPTVLDIYALGEAREDGEFDCGWIINADTRETIWKLTWQDSAAAGGALKNRVVQTTRTLPAGRYAAFYVTDDSHDQSEWNAPPPHDPEFWGLTVRPHDGTHAGIRTFPYEHVPENATIVALTRIGDRESRQQGFTLNKPMDVRIYAIGEGSNGRMVDYGFITGGETGRRIWEMRYGETEHAGGNTKNRQVDTTLHLDAGTYMVHYISDQSHSAGEWNAAAPADWRHWGITVLAARGPLDRTAIGPYVERANPGVLAEMTAVRDDDRQQKRFVLDRETNVRIVAVGEGTRSGMVDYGWIENARTGRTVWEMTYRTTEHAGGASKNRRIETTITLPAGEYVVKYETDGSHAFGRWNSEPPDEPEAWGITVSRVRQ
jgi:hypothetical protein